MTSKRKRRRKAGPQYNLHHRKCRSNGGDNHPDNLIEVRVDDHRRWHRIFENRRAIEIAYLLQHTMMAHFRIQLQVHRLSTGAIKVIPKGAIVGSNVSKARAWRKLFYGFSMEEILDEINTVWLDPEFRIEVHDE